MPDGIDTGNPNVFKTYFGRYEVDVTENVTSTSNTIMHSCVNDAQFCGNFTYDGAYTVGTVLFTIPPELTPSLAIYIPIPIQVITGGQLDFLVVNSDGNVWASQSYDSPTFRLRGLSYNLACNFYS